MAPTQTADHGLFSDDASAGALSDPLTPPDCDLRGMPYMPLDLVRLFDSGFYILSSGDEFKAGLSLWGRAFLQVPAGSLPNDDRMLAHLSGAGPLWPKVRDKALHGWVLCSDGRLYHPVVAEKALSSWHSRLERRARTEAARAKRHSVTRSVTENATDTATKNVTTTVTSAVTDNATTSATGSNRTERYTVTETRKKEPHPSLRDGPSPTQPADPATQAFDAFVALAAELALPKPRLLDPDRRAKLRKRLDDAGGLPGWLAALDAVRASPFLRGQTSAGFRCNLDFLLQPSSLRKVLDGNYAAQAPTKNPAPSPREPSPALSDPNDEWGAAAFIAAIPEGTFQWEHEKGTKNLVKCIDGWNIAAVIEFFCVAAKIPHTARPKLDIVLEWCRLGLEITDRHVLDAVASTAANMTAPVRSLAFFDSTVRSMAPRTPPELLGPSVPIQNSQIA